MTGCATGEDAAAECSSKKSMAWGLPFSLTEKSDFGRPGTGSPFFLSTTTSTRTWRAVVRKTGMFELTEPTAFSGAGGGGKLDAGGAATGAGGGAELAVLDASCGAGWDSGAGGFDESVAALVEDAACELLGGSDVAWVAAAREEAFASSACFDPFPFGVGEGWLSSLAASLSVSTFASERKT